MRFFYFQKYSLESRDRGYLVLCAYSNVLTVHVHVSASIRVLVKLP